MLLTVIVRRMLRLVILKIGSPAGMRRRVRTRLLVPTLIVAAWFFALAAYRAVQLRQAQEQLQLSNALQLANMSARTIDATIAETHTLLVSIAELLDPTRPSAANDIVLQRIFRAAPVPYANLWMADTSGRSLGAARVADGKRSSFFVGDRKYFRDAMRLKRFSIGDVVQSRTLPGNPRVIAFALPVIDSVTGRVIAVVGASIEMDSLEAVRGARSLPNGSVLTIMDSMRTIVYRTLDPDHWIGRTFEARKDRLEDFAVGRGVGTGMSADGTFRLTGFHTTERAPWVLYVGIPAAYTLGVVQSQFVRDVMLGTLITLFVLFFGYRFIIGVVAPIESLTDDTRAIAAGNMSRRSIVQSNDEIGDLARAFNQMADTIADRNTALRASQEQLLHVQKMDALGSFAGGIAHDFNNYLASIVAYTELADLSLDDEHPARLDLREVLASSARAADLTRQILVFSRKQVVELRTLDMNEIVRGIERMLIRLAGEHSQLRIRYSDDAVLVHADHGQLEQVIVNLVANARDAMPDGGTITLSMACVTLKDGDPHLAAPAGATVAQLSVTDEGTGIESEILDRIFDPFFSTKERGRGTGLGLAIAYSIIEQRGGRLSVDSTLRVGTTFTFTLPLAAACEPAAPPAVTSSLRVVSSGMGRILLAEDDAAVRSSCERMLVHAGYSVIAAADGPSALHQMRSASERFDLLLSDVVMPGMSGSELARRVKDLQPDIAVLFMSGYADDVLLQDELAAQAVTCIAKPFTVRALCDAVGTAIAQRQTVPER